MKTHFDTRRDKEADGVTHCGLDIGRNFRSMRYRQMPLQVTTDINKVTCVVSRL